MAEAVADVKIEVEKPVEESAKSEKPVEEKLKTAKPEGGRKKFIRRYGKEFYEERRRAWEEAQKEKEVLETGLKGTVKWYSIVGRYGFIERADKQGDVFVHQSVIAKSSVDKYFLRTLENGEEVCFDIVQGKKGQEAANVTGPDGTEVKGSKYFRILLRHNNRSYRRRSFDGKRGGERKASKKPSSRGAPEEADKEKGVDSKDDEKKPRRKFYRRRNNRRFKVKNSESGAKGDEKEAGEPRRRRQSSMTKSTTDASTEANLAGGDSRTPVDA